MVHVRVIEYDSNVMLGSPEKWYDSGVKDYVQLQTAEGRAGCVNMDKRTVLNTWLGNGPAK